MPVSCHQSTRFSFKLVVIYSFYRTHGTGFPQISK